MAQFTKTVLASLAALSAAGVHAAAFQLAEVSTSGLGLAYAGNAAVADNASVVATNPALMTKFKQVEISAGGVYVDGDINIEGKLNGTPFDASHRNIVPNAIVPNAYIVAPVSERFTLGGGINVNYGLKSEFNPSYNAGFFGGKTDLTALNVNLSGAYDLGAGFSIGAGINAVHAKAELVRYLGLAGKAAAQQAAQRAQALQAQAQQADTAGQSALAQALRTGATTALAAANAYNSLDNSTVIHKLKGDTWGFGWNLGLTYDINENNRLGIAYRSAIDLKFKGKYSNTIPLALPGAVDTITGGAEQAGSLNLTLPAYWEVSGYHKLTDKLAAQYSYKRTDWSSFKSLDAYGQNNNRLFHKTENFNDSQRIALGFSYDVNDMLTLRTGIAYDESASVSNPSISIPDTDRTWYALGATVRVTPNLSADIGYSHIRGSKLTFNEEGRATFTSKAKANLYGLNVNYKF